MNGDLRRLPLGTRMFAQWNPGNPRRQRWLRTASLAVHGLLLAWILHTPNPQLLTANSVAIGQNGASVTRLYWPSKSPDDSSQSSSDRATQRYRHERFSHEKLTWKAPSQPTKLPAPQNTLARTNAEDNSQTQTLSALGHGAQAGLPYGTLSSGPFSGNEIRPALPITTSDPAVYPWQLPASPGNEIIEITIDERGEIVGKTVLQSLGPDIDDKCLAALDNWHFHPATRNGTAIPSKQDAIFPFRARG
jgi:outer membrane biosynthesis protein TonB